MRFGHVVLHTSGVGGNRFNGGTRFALGMFCHVHMGKAKKRWFGLNDLFVPSVLQQAAWDV